MFKNKGTKQQFQVADLKLDPESGQIWRGSNEISLPKLSFQLFKVLVENAPNVLSQDELISKVWPDMVVGDETLKQRVRLLRKSIGDNAQSPIYIGVVRGRGYRLLPDVAVQIIDQTTPLEYDLASSDRVPNLFSSTTQQQIWQKVSLALTVLICLLIGFLYLLSSQQKSQNSNRNLQHLAILPFVNVSNNAEDDYLSSGMTNELIQVMSAIDSLTVSPRSSVMRYNHSERKISDISKQLNVGAILDGAVYRRENQLHFSFKLINSGSFETIWQAEYDFQSDDILAIQRKVITQVTEHLKAKLNPTQLFDSLSLTQPTQVIEAYNFYLKGRNYYNRYRQADNRTAIKMYQQALELDENFALAHAGLADAYSQGVFQFGEGELWRKKALESANRAVKIDNDKAESHKALGLSHYLNGSIELAIKANLRAIKLSPGHAQAATNLAYLYRHQGQLKKALAWNLRALEISPVSAPVHAHLGQTYASMALPEKAKSSYLKAIQLQPDYPFARGLYAKYLFQNNKKAKALELLHQALKTYPQEWTYLWTLAEIRLYSGEYAEAIKIYRQLLSNKADNDNLELRLMLTISESLYFNQPDRLAKIIKQWQQQRLVKSDNPQDYFYLALAFAASKNITEKNNAIINAKQLGWNNLPLLKHIQLFNWPTLVDNSKIDTGN